MRRITRNPSIAVRSTEGPSQEPEDQMVAPISVRIATAVRMTGIGRSKLYELIQEGAIDIVKIGSATLIPIASLHRLLERNRR
jgi:excisionase family DNA binding protein